MYCTHCGSYINPGSTVCPRCGAAIPGGTPPVVTSVSDDRTWAMLAHVAGFLPVLGGILGPLIIYLTKGNESAFVHDQAAEALNWHISIFIYCMVSIPLMIIGIGFLLVAAIGVCNIIFSIMGAVQANNGEYYRYPLSIRFIK